MEDGDREKYQPSRVIHDFVFLSRKRGCIRCIFCRYIIKGFLAHQIMISIVFTHVRYFYLTHLFHTPYQP